MYNTHSVHWKKKKVTILMSFNFPDMPIQKLWPLQETHQKTKAHCSQSSLPTPAVMAYGQNINSRISWCFLLYNLSSDLVFRQLSFFCPYGLFCPGLALQRKPDLSFGYVPMRTELAELVGSMKLQDPETKS